jgi:hypothetical protein
LMLDDLYPELDFSKVPKIAGVPRFALRQAAAQLWRYLRTRSTGDAVDSLAQELYLIEYAGLFAQCWKRWRHGGTDAAARRAPTIRATVRVALLLAVLGASALSALAAPAPRVLVSIREGRVWITAERATAGEILAEWARVGQTQIANGERIGGEPLTLDISGMPEAAALDLVLHSAAGYVAVDRAAARWTAPTMSRYARIVIVSSGGQPVEGTRASAPVAAEPSPPPPPAVVPPLSDSVETAPGVRRLIGADGLPVPDDQEDVPPPPTSPPAGQRGRGGG